MCETHPEPVNAGTAFRGLAFHNGGFERAGPQVSLGFVVELDVEGSAGLRDGFTKRLQCRRA